MTNSVQQSARSNRAILSFCALAFIWSWSLGYAAAHVRLSFPALSMALAIVSGFGPSMAGVTVVAAFSDRQGMRDWLSSCFNRQVDWRWFAIAFLVPPVVMLMTLGLHISLGGVVPAPILATQIPLAIANFGLVLLVGGPLGEEFGWRGYAMSALMARTSWRVASVIIGVVWGLWHLPLFFMIGTTQSHMPVLVFMINIVAGSVLFGWLFVRTKGSVLPALVLHTSLNTWAGLLIIVPSAATGRPYAIVTALLVVIAVALLIKAGPTPPEAIRRAGSARC